MRPTKRQIKGLGGLPVRQMPMTGVPAQGTAQRSWKQESVLQIRTFPLARKGRVRMVTEGRRQAEHSSDAVILLQVLRLTRMVSTRRSFP